MESISIHERVNNGDGLLIHGVLSTGKTAMAVLFAKEVIRRGGVITFIPMSDFMDIKVKDLKVKGEEETIMERVHRSHLVILDDLGTETFGKNANGLAALEGILRSIYNNKASVIVTSNRLSAELAKEYPSSIVSLLKRIRF